METAGYLAALLLIGSLGLAGNVQAQAQAHVRDHAHVHESKHGGIVSESKDMDYELVVRPEGIYLYLRDHGKPVDASKASGKLTILVGADKQEVTMTGTPGRLEAIGEFKVPSDTKIVAAVTLPGKATTNVRFSVK